MKNRKFLLMGIIMFCLVAIVTTTFATFVITGGENHANIDTGPNVSVGEIQSNIVDLSATMNDSAMKVDAEVDDNEGRVVESDSLEDLSVSIDLKVTGNKANWENVKITVNFENNDDSGKSLLVLDSSMSAADNVITISKEDFVDGNETEGWTLKKTITFDYGVATDSLNPSVYLDTNGVWKDNGTGHKSAQDVQEELKRLLALYKTIQITFDVDVTPAQSA